MTFKDKTLSAVQEKLTSTGGRILVVQTAFIGDVILVTPLLKAIRDIYPRAELHILTIPQCADIVTGLVDNVITLNKEDRNSLPAAIADLVRQLRSLEFELALIPHRSYRSGRIIKAIGVPVRIGFRRGSGSIFHTHKVKYIFDEYEGHRNLRLLGPLTDIDGLDSLPLLIPQKADLKRADEIITELRLTYRRFVILSPASVWKTKRWPMEYFKELANRINEEFNLPVLAIGGMSDRELCSSIVIEEQFNLAGKLSVLGSAALVQKAGLMISGDTAPAHIATAMRIPQVIIFGSTVPGFGFSPALITSKARILERRLLCRPCTDHGKNCCIRLNSFKCLYSIEPELVLRIAGELLCL